MVATFRFTRAAMDFTICLPTSGFASFALTLAHKLPRRVCFAQWKVDQWKRPSIWKAGHTWPALCGLMKSDSGTRTLGSRSLMWMRFQRSNGSHGTFLFHFWEYHSTYSHKDAASVTLETVLASNVSILNAMVSSIYTTIFTVFQIQWLSTLVVPSELNSLWT